MLFAPKENSDSTIQGMTLVEYALAAVCMLILALFFVAGYTWLATVLGDKVTLLPF